MAKASKKVSVKTSLGDGITMKKGSQPMYGRVNKYSVVLVLVVLLGWLLMQKKYLVMVANVNGVPIYSWQYVQALHEAGGTNVANQLVIEELIKQKARENNVTVSQEEIDAEIADLEKQFEEGGGLDAFLTQQGMTREVLVEQIELNIKIEKLVKDKIAITDEQIAEYFETNKTLFEDKTLEEVQGEIRDSLYNQQMQQEVGVWIQELRTEASVKVYLPGVQLN